MTYGSPYLVAISTALCDKQRTGFHLLARADTRNLVYHTTFRLPSENIQSFFMLFIQCTDAI